MPNKKKNFKSLADVRCWQGYERTPGTKAGEPGSCRKKNSSSSKKKSK